MMAIWLCITYCSQSTLHRPGFTGEDLYAISNRLVAGFGGLKAIREKSPFWLQNAIDLALVTAQRRTDILSMRFDGVREGFLYVVQQKTAKASDAAWIRFKVTEELQAVISRCRDDIVSPYLIHRRPDRKKQKQAQTKDHWTQVEERYLTRAFKEAREVAGCYKGWKEEEMPGFHEVRALSLHLYQKAGKCELAADLAPTRTLQEIPS
jgi:integrase